VSRSYAEVIGDPIAQSKSPLIHNFWLEKLGIDAEYRACHVRTEELADYFAQRRGDTEWRGCNVTMPHKQTVILLVDDFAPEAIEATNTIVATAEGLKAWNTDVTGIEQALRPFVPETGDDRPFHPRFARVQIVGAGGASHAAIDAVSNLGLVNIEIFNRSLDRARDMAPRAGLARNAAYSLDQLGPRSGGSANWLNEADCRYFVINASPMGMLGNEPVKIPLEAYPPDTVVFDMVYAPLETPLLASARRLKMDTVDGLAMLIGQAAAAFEKFFGQPAPREHDVELRALLTA
jgi:shikimate dehydrogenase